MSNFKGTDCEWNITPNKSWGNSENGDGFLIMYQNGATKKCLGAVFSQFMDMTKKEVKANSVLIENSLPMLRMLERIQSGEKPSKTELDGLIKKCTDI